MKAYSVPTVPIEHIIPRMIHQVFLGGTLPAPLQQNVDQLRSLNPGWEHRLYDDAAVEAFIEEHYGRAILGYYRRIDPSYAAARSDLFRYLVIYRVGGVYLDVKSAFRRPIDETLRRDEHFIVSRWRNGPGEPHEGFGCHPELTELGEEIQQWHVIAAPGHPFLRAVIEAVLDGIDSYSPRKDDIGLMGVLRLTGPIAYSRAIIPLLGQHPCTIIDNESVIGLQFSVFAGLDHRRIYRNHYSDNTAPIIIRPGLDRLLDLSFIGIRNLKRRLKERMLAPRISQSGVEWPTSA